jgi:hypothetical protein
MSLIIDFFLAWFTKIMLIVGSIPLQHQRVALLLLRPSKRQSMPATALPPHHHVGVTPPKLTTTTMMTTKTQFPLPPLLSTSLPCHPFPQVFAHATQWWQRQGNLPSRNHHCCPPTPLSPPHCCFSGSTTYSFFLLWGTREGNLLYLDNCYTYCTESSRPEFWNLRQRYFFYVGNNNILQTRRINTREGFFW